MEDWIATEVGPSVAAVPVGEETTAIPEFTTEPENQTEWEPAYTPAGTSPLPGLCGLGSGARPNASHAWQPRVCPGWGEGRVVSPWDLCSVSPALTLAKCAAVGNFGRERAALFIKHTSFPLSLSLSFSLSALSSSYTPQMPSTVSVRRLSLCAPAFTRLLSNLLKTLLQEEFQ